jgi:hypothetical protein
LPQPLIFAIFQGLFVLYMKTIVTFLAFFGLLYQSPAQSAFSNVEQIIVNGITYVCENDAKYYSLVYNSNNPSLQWNPGNEPPAPQECREMNPTIKINQISVKNAINTVFSPERKNQLKEENFSMNLFIKPATGEIGDVYFHLSKSTQITPQEIYQVEQALRGLLMPANPTCASKSYIVYPYRVKWTE